MNRRLAYWNNYIVNDDFDLRPTLRYKDIKDIPILIAKRQYWITKADPITAVYDPKQIIYKSKDEEWITLEQALKLYKDRPELFRVEELKILYSYIAFYDPQIMKKIKKRLDKFNRHGIYNLL